MTLEVIRGKILTKCLRIRVPAEQARQPGWTRLEAVGKILEEIGLEVEGANRVMVVPVAATGDCIVTWHEFV